MIKFIKGLSTIKNEGFKEWFLGLGKLTRIKIISLIGFFICLIAYFATEQEFFGIGSLIFLLIYFIAFLMKTVVDIAEWAKKLGKGLTGIENTAKETIGNLLELFRKRGGYR